MRNLVLVLGDQLSHDLSAWDEFDAEQDLVWMAEVHEEASKVPCHKTRLVFFFAAMRHFRDELLNLGKQVRYHELTERANEDQGTSFAELLEITLGEYQPQKVIVTEPGDWFVREQLEHTCEQNEVSLEIREDRHFYCSVDEFSKWSAGKKQLILENFYRWMRKQHGVMLLDNGKPLGGQWNFDKDNRKPFGKAGPRVSKSKADRDEPDVVVPVQKFKPDKITQEVMRLVEARFAEHPGSCEEFAYPVNRKQARASLKDFVENRLSKFGDFQDAMWTGTDFLNHSRLSAVINVHLLDPREVVEAALDALEENKAPLNSVEGFVRQVIGWREFVRGIYWTWMPEYIERNALECEGEIPSAFWDGETEMNCVREAMQPVLKYAYAHHIQRLMVLGLYAQLLGVHPRKFHDWHMAMYADAIDWVSLPNTLGMSQHGDGAVVGTKPYCASGSYIDRMSNYCKSCRFNPKQAVGEKACPMTTLYWDFLDRHHDRFQDNGRMTFQIRNLENKPEEDLVEIREQATRHREEVYARG